MPAIMSRIGEEEMQRRINALRSSQFFCHCTDNELRGLAQDMKEEIFRYVCVCVCVCAHVCVCGWV